MRVTKKLQSINNVSAGSTAVLNLVIGPTYDSIVMTYSGVTQAQIKNIKLKANGKDFQTFKDAAELQNINKYWGRPDDAAGFLTFWFVRPEMALLSDQRLTALGTADLKTLSIEFDIDASATAPVISASAVMSESQPFGVCTKVKAYTSATAVAGLKEIDNIPLGGARIIGIHNFKADISHSEVRVNDSVAFDVDKTLAENIQKKANTPRVPLTASCSHIDWILEGDPSQAMVTQGVQDFRLLLTCDTAGSIRTVVEYIDGLAGI